MCKSVSVCELESLCVRVSVCESVCVRVSVCESVCVSERASRCQFVWVESHNLSDQSKQKKETQICEQHHIPQPSYLIGSD